MIGEVTEGLGFTQLKETIIGEEKSVQMSEVLRSTMIFLLIVRIHELSTSEDLFILLSLSVSSIQRFVSLL